MAGNNGACANPLFEKWLCAWIEKAKSINAPVFVKYEKALTSLRKYPLILNSGRECMILEHFNPPLCIKLDRKLAIYRNCERNAIRVEGSDPQTSAPPESCSSEAKKMKLTEKSDHSKEEQAKKPNKKSYEPRYRSAAFALLLSLLEDSHTNGTKGAGKSDLQKSAQKYCDASFTKPLPGSYYTAWTSMAQLVQKSLVHKAGNPARFTLTNEGVQLAMKLKTLYSVNTDKVSPEVGSQEQTVDVPKTSDLLAPCKRGSKKKKQTESQERENDRPEDADVEEGGPDYFLPHSFDVILLVDSCETIGAAKKTEDETIRELTSRQVKFEVRRLKVGDFLWVARHRESAKELVLPYIVERKRLDDLASSIKDGRFAEQKFRLKQCELKCLIYLVEFMGAKEFHGLPLSSLMQAVTNTQIVDNFSVKLTSCHSESMMYLGFLTKIFSDIFSAKTLFCCKKEDLQEIVDLEDCVVSLCTYQNFSHNIGKSRNFSVAEMFMKQLVQLYGVSADKAWSIVEKYPTPRVLTEAFQNHGENILADLTYGHLNGKIGSAISKTLFCLYTKTKFD